MSKMSQLHAELTQQAAELGFMSIEEAEQAGYRVDWLNSRLVKADDAEKTTSPLSLSDDMLGLHELPAHADDMFRALDAWAEDGLDEAHKEWLKERDEVLEEQAQLHERLTVLGYDALAESVYRAIKFIREQCHD